MVKAADRSFCLSVDCYQVDWRDACCHSLLSPIRRRSSKPLRCPLPAPFNLQCRPAGYGWPSGGSRGPAVFKVGRGGDLARRRRLPAPRLSLTAPARRPVSSGSWSASQQRWLVITRSVWAPRCWPSKSSISHLFEFCALSDCLHVAFDAALSNKDIWQRPS